MIIGHGLTKMIPQHFFPSFEVSELTTIRDLVEGKRVTE